MNKFDPLQAGTETGAAFAIGLAGAEERELNGHPYYINPLTGEAKSLEHLLSAPLRRPKNRHFETVESLIAYTNRFKRPQSSIYASGSSIRVEIDHSSEAEEVWPDHTASVNFDHSEEFSKWLDLDDKPLGQEAFAEHLETRAREIVAPQSAEIIEIARALSIQKNLAVTSVVRSGGNQQISFSGEQKIKGGPKDVEVPTRFEIRVRPFLRQAAWVDIQARLRVRIVNDHPIFSYKLQDVQERIDSVLDDILNGAAEKTGLPLYR